MSPLILNHISHVNTYHIILFNLLIQDRRGGDGVKYSALESRFFGDVFKSSLDNDLSGYDGKRLYPFLLPLTMIFF